MNTTMSGVAGAGDRDDFFFYLAQKIDSPIDEPTGREIKALIKAVVPSFDESHILVLEGAGHHEDHVIQDGQKVSVEVGHGHPPKHFFSKPPTNFGA